MATLRSFAQHPRVPSHVDMPLPNTPRRVLRRMRRRRRPGRASTRARSRAHVSTAFVVKIRAKGGVPGFEFVRWAEFDRVAAFPLDEEECRARRRTAKFLKIAATRYRKLMATQRPISHAKTGRSSARPSSRRSTSDSTGRRSHGSSRRSGPRSTVRSTLSGGGRPERSAACRSRKPDYDLGRARRRETLPHVAPFSPCPSCPRRATRTAEARHI